MSKFVTQDGIERLIGIVKSELDGKSDTGHTHEIADVNGLQIALDDKLEENDMCNYIWGGENAPNQIQASEDLNNFTTFGIYFSDGSPITSTLLNCPTSDKAGRLEVICLGTTGEVVQKWIRKDGAIEWTRAYRNNEWTTWDKIIKQTELDTRAPWQSVSVLTQAEYDAITTPVSTTLYLIKEA